MASTNTTDSEEEVGVIDPAREVDLELLEKALEDARRELVESAEDASSILRRLADEIDDSLKKWNKGKILGSASSLLGLPILSAGVVFAGLFPWMVAVGGALSGFGGMTAAGSSLAEHFITRSMCKEAQKAVDVVNEKARKYEKKRKELKEMPLSSGVSSSAEEPWWNHGARLAIGVQVVEGATTAYKAFKAGLPILSKGFLMVNALAVPYDIYTLAKSTVKEFRSTGSPQANKIRELANKLHDWAQQIKEGRAQDA